MIAHKISSICDHFMKIYMLISFLLTKFYVPLLYPTLAYEKDAAIITIIIVVAHYSVR